MYVYAELLTERSGSRSPAKAPAPPTMPMAPGLNRRLKNIEEGSKGGLNSDSLLLDNMTESQLGKGTVAQAGVCL